MERPHWTDGAVTEMRLARIKVVDDAAVRIGALGRLRRLRRSRSVSMQSLVLLHGERLRMQVAWIAGHLRERRRHSQETEIAPAVRARGNGRFMSFSPLLEPEDEPLLPLEAWRNLQKRKGAGLAEATFWSSILVLSAFASRRLDRLVLLMS